MRVEFTFDIGEDKDGQPIDNLDLKLERIQTQLAKAFGGFTRTDTVGGWINPTGRLVLERGCVIHVYAKDELVQYAGQIASDIRRVLNQATVLLSLGGNDPIEIVV